MIHITLIESSGTEHKIETKEGLSVMEVATAHNIPTIEADCGGACACATCHVYIDSAWSSSTGKASAAEEDMLDFAFQVKPNSRLCCQILLKKEHDGLIIHLPEKQF